MEWLALLVAILAVLLPAVHWGIKHRELVKDFAAITHERDSLKEAKAALEAENAALKQQVAEASQRKAVNFEPLDYPGLGLPKGAGNK